MFQKFFAAGFLLTTTFALLFVPGSFGGQIRHKFTSLMGRGTGTGGTANPLCLGCIQTFIDTTEECGKDGSCNSCAAYVLAGQGDSFPCDDEAEWYSGMEIGSRTEKGSDSKNTDVQNFLTGTCSWYGICDRKAQQIDYLCLEPKGGDYKDFWNCVERELPLPKDFIKGKYGCVRCTPIWTSKNPGPAELCTNCPPK